MEYVYSFTVALFLTTVLIPLLINFPTNFRLAGLLYKIDHDPSSLPVVSGLAIVLGSCPVLIFLPSLQIEIFSTLTACAVIILVEQVSYSRKISYNALKLLSHCVAIVIVMLGGIVIHKVPFLGLDDASVWVSYPLTFFFLLSVINGSFFSDGLEEVAAGVYSLILMFIAFLAVLINHQEVVLMCLTVAGSIFGILRYNIFSSRILIGKIGSQCLGLISVCLAIIVTQSGQSALSPFLPAMILALPMINLMQRIFVRAFKKANGVSERNNIYTQLIDLGFAPYQIEFITMLFCVILLLNSYFLRFEMDLLVAAFFLSFSVIALFLINHPYLLKKSKNKNQYESREPYSRRNLWLRQLDAYYSTGAVILQRILIVFFIVSPFLLINANEQLAYITMAFGVLIVLLRIFLHEKIMYISRFASYLIIIILVSMLSMQLEASWRLYLVDIVLVLIAIVLVVVMRLTRKGAFNVVIQDLIILAGLIVTPVLLASNMDMTLIALIALRSAILIYSCEYLLARRTDENYRYLTVGAAAGLFSISIMMLS